MIENLVNKLGNNKYEFQFETRYSNYGYGASKWGDFYGASRDYWYGDYGAAQKEVVADEVSGEPTCYYCGSNDLQNSEYGEDFKYCMECVSDIYCGKEEEITDPNQVSIEYGDYKEEMKDWNKSSGITKDIDYKDISDSYDDSIAHKTIVNEYLKKK